jgi:vanillin dehydrogenase
MLDTRPARTLRGMYIGGHWVRAARSFADINPNDGSLWAEAPDGTARDAAAAIEAAQRAFPDWAGLKFNERAKLMNRIADVWERRAPDFIAAVQTEGGGWHGKGAFEAHYVPDVFRAAAATCFDATGEVLPSAYGKLSTAIRFPMGVISVISPWNFPGILTARGFAFPLAAGNTIVLKPSEDTPYIGGLFFAEVLEEAGVPAGVFNVVTCSRENVVEVGDEMIEHPFVKGISFTGSTPVGRSIAAKAGAHLKKCCVELGGKDSLIVLRMPSWSARRRRRISAASCTRARSACRSRRCWCRSGSFRSSWRGSRRARRS